MATFKALIKSTEYKYILAYIVCYRQDFKIITYI